jgi:multidrug transporter EmrE-like cation transporter
MVMPVQELSLGITLAVLGAGLLHAGWNALLKSAPGGDPMLDTATVVAGSCVWALVVLPFVPLPDPSAWKFIAASTVIHFAYYVTLAHAYRTGDLSFAYPLMRGSAPLIVAVLGVAFLQELPTTHAMLGIVLICTGIVSIAFVRRERHPAAAARWAFANAAIIAAYTLVDGAGVRASGNPLAYVSWLLALEGLPYLAWVLWRGRAPARRIAPKPSFNHTAPISAANSTDVSRNAATAATGARVIANRTMPYAARLAAPPTSPRRQPRCR